MICKANPLVRAAAVAFAVGVLVGIACTRSIIQARALECAIQMEAARLARDPNRPMSRDCAVLRARAFAPAIERVTGTDVTRPYP